MNGKFKIIAFSPNRFEQISEHNQKAILAEIQIKEQIIAKVVC